MTSSDSGVQYDVIVVGAGIEGSSTAYSLVKDGKKVLLLEQFPLPHGRGSSAGHSRITRYAYEEEFYVRMMVDAFPLWDTLHRESGVDFFVNCGMLDIRNPGSPGETRLVAALKAHNITHEVLDPAQLKKKFPMLSSKDGKCGAVWDPSGGLLRADKCLMAFQTVFRRLGGEVRDSEPVTSVTPAGHVVKVMTSQDTYTAGHVVIATGPWTGRFTEALNLDLPFRPIRISVHYWRVRDADDQAVTSQTSMEKLPCILDSREGSSTGPQGQEGGRFHVYGLPVDEYPGLVKVALHDGPEINPDHRDGVGHQWVDQVVTGYVKELLPGLDHSQPVISEACIYTNTPDTHPFIDRHPEYDNVIICAGFSGHGFKLAPAVGKAVTEMVNRETPSYDMTHFRLDRFSPKSKM